MSRAPSPSPAGSARPTLKTIARISGFAMTTVSRALGDAPDISETTKRRVREIADEIGYIPNRAGVRLRTGRTNVICLVLATENDTLNMTSNLIAAISEGLQGTPYHLVMIPEPPGQDPLQAIRNIVENRSADAVILNRIEPYDDRIRYLQEKDFPFATHGRSALSDSHSYFDFDNTAFGELAVRTLADRGRKRILLVAPPLIQSYARHIVSGATQAAEDLGLALTVSPHLTDDNARPDFLAGLADYLAEAPPYDALITASPNSAMLSAYAVEGAGKVIGKDFDIFTKETIPFLNLFRPQILALREDVSKAGRFLAKAAVHEIARSAPGHMQEIDRPLPPDAEG